MPIHAAKPVSHNERARRGDGYDLSVSTMQYCPGEARVIAYLAFGGLSIIDLHRILGGLTLCPTLGCFREWFNVVGIMGI